MDDEISETGFWDPNVICENCVYAHHGEEECRRYPPSELPSYFYAFMELFVEHLGYKIQDVERLEGPNFSNPKWPNVDLKKHNCGEFRHYIEDGEELSGKSPLDDFLIHARKKGKDK